jgi:hypothetical protein
MNQLTSSITNSLNLNSNTNNLDNNNISIISSNTSLLTNQVNQNIINISLISSNTSLLNNKINQNTENISLISSNTSLLNNSIINTNNNLYNFTNRIYSNYYLLKQIYYNDSTITSIGTLKNLTTTFTNSTGKLNFFIEFSLTLYNSTAIIVEFSSPICYLNGNPAKYMTTAKVLPSGNYIISGISNVGSMISGNNIFNITFIPYGEINIYNYWVKVSTDLSLP